MPAVVYGKHLLIKCRLRSAGNNDVVVETTYLKGIIDPISPLTYGLQRELRAAVLSLGMFRLVQRRPFRMEPLEELPDDPAPRDPFPNMRAADDDDEEIGDKGIASPAFQCKLC